MRLMATNNHEPRQAEGADFIGSIRIGLDEAFTALLESFDGLADDQFHAWPLDGRHNIVTLVEHCIQALDLWACEVQGRALVYEPEHRFDIVGRTAAEIRAGLEASGPLPTVVDERGRVERLRDAAMRHLEATSPDDLTRPIPGCWWYDENPGRTRADAYMRAIHHNSVHVRQIWALRDLLGAIDGGTAWPRQHWA